MWTGAWPSRWVGAFLWVSLPRQACSGRSLIRTAISRDRGGVENEDEEGDETATLNASAVELPGKAPRQENNQAYREPPLIPPSLGLSSETMAGSRVGTPSFMSPEQAAGRIDQLGPACDIYSLGATLYNILTGKPPFVGTDLTKTLHRVIKGDFPRPCKIKPTVPRALEGIVLKAMALEPGMRDVSAKAPGDDIEHWMADEPVSAYRDPWLARAGRLRTITIPRWLPRPRCWSRRSWAFRPGRSPSSGNGRAPNMSEPWP